MALSPAALRICTIAVDYLADRGYDRSSLSEIADLAGMKKASLYSHFKSKDALVSELLALAVVAEEGFINECFSRDDGNLKGGEYLRRLSDRFAASSQLRFLLRTAYAPPVTMRESVIETHQSFTTGIRVLFQNALPSDTPTDTSALLTESYLGIIDSLQVELLYGESTSVELRRHGLWTLLEVYARQPRPAS